MNRLEFFLNLGFSEYESKIIFSMEKMRKSSVAEISFDSGVPKNKIYGILKRFEKEGLVQVYGDKTYSLINFKEFIKEKINEKEILIKELKKESKKIHNPNLAQEFVFSLIKGQKATMNKLAESNSKSKKEIIGVQRNWKVWGGGLRAMEYAIKKGVKVKFVGIIDEETKSRAKEWKDVGCSIRAYNNDFGEFPLRFTIFDNKEARITIGKPEIKNSEDYVTIWTNSKPLINILRKQFVEMWKYSKRF